MVEKGYFLRLTGAFILGFAALIIAVIAFFLFLPFLMTLGPVLMPGIVLGVFLILAFIIIWIVVYVCMVIGVAIYYAFTTSTKWEKKDKGYKIEKTKEEGKREKG